MSVHEVAVLGATGAVGEQLLAMLATAALPLGVVRVFGGAGRSRRVDEVRFGEETLGVEAITNLGDATPGLVFSCVPSAVAAHVVPGLASRGAFVIDVGNATAGVLDAPLVHPGLGPDLPDGIESIVRTPTAPGWLLAPVVAALVDVGLTGVSGTLALPATSRGRAAIDELGQQVVASFSGQDPPRRVFPDGLAFDVVPEEAEADEWSDGERLAAAEVATLTGFAAERIGVTFGTFPLFAGMVASLHLRGVRAGSVEEALRASPGLVAAPRPEKLRPRVLAGKSAIGWGRLREDPGGDGVHLWLIADNLAGAGASAPVEVARRAIAAGLVR